jgi:CubicO group peptidase (beta-lactamase class C family)
MVKVHYSAIAIVFLIIASFPKAHQKLILDPWAWERPGVAGSTALVLGYHHRQEQGMAATHRKLSQANMIFQDAVDTAIREKGEVGLQVAAYLDGKPVVDVWGGVADLTTGRPVDRDTLFPVFSVVKAVAAIALHIQAERGLIEYEAPIARYWPEFAANGKGSATIRDALSHRLGIPQMPSGVTPSLMSDYEWMIEHLAQLKPLFTPGAANAYMCYTFGWVIAECVRRTDPQRRPFGAFVQQEICAPLQIDDVWVGIPGELESRVARLIDAPNRPLPPDSPIFSAIPPQVTTKEEIFGRSDVRRACIPGANGIMNARSAARLFAMLANGGELDGARLLSQQRVTSFSVPRFDTDRPDGVLGYPARVGTAGFWLGGTDSAAEDPCQIVGRNPRTICHPGAGGSIAWANPDTRLAVAICHNRMTHAPGVAFEPIKEAVQEVFGVQ